MRSYPRTFDDLVQKQVLTAFIHNRDFCADVLFIRAEIEFGAWERAKQARNARRRAGRD